MITFIHRRAQSFLFSGGALSPGAPNLNPSPRQTYLCRLSFPTRTLPVPHEHDTHLTLYRVSPRGLQGHFNGYRAFGVCTSGLLGPYLWSGAARHDGGVWFSCRGRGDLCVSAPFLGCERWPPRRRKIEREREREREPFLIPNCFSAILFFVKDPKCRTSS